MAKILEIHLKETPESGTLGGLIVHLRTQLGRGPSLDYNLDNGKITIKGDFDSKKVYQQIKDDSYEIDKKRERTI